MLAILESSPVRRVATAKADLEEVLGRDEGLVVLDDASPILAMEVLRSHRAVSKEAGRPA